MAGELGYTLCLVIAFSPEEMEGENNGCKAGSGGGGGFMCCCDFAAPFISFRVTRLDFLCLKLSVPPWRRGTARGDLFI